MEGLQGIHYPHFSSSARVLCVCVPSLALDPHPLLLFFFVRICTPPQLLYFPSHLIFYLPVSPLASWSFFSLCLSPEFHCENHQVAFSFSGVSVQFNRSVMSDSLWPHVLQHTRLPCPSPTPRVYSNSCPLSRWCHPTTSSSVVPFSSRLQSFPASGSFQMSQFFASDGQNIGASASTSVLLMNIQDWFSLGWTGWISCSPRDSQESSPTPQFKSINSLALSFLYSPTLTSIYDYRRNHSLD